MQQLCSVQCAIILLNVEITFFVFTNNIVKSLSLDNNNYNMT